MNSAAETRRARARGRRRAAARLLSEPARWPARPLERPVPTPGPAPAHARPRSHRAAAGRPHILELAGAPEHGENALLPGRPAAPAAGRPRACLADGPGPFSTPGPRLPAAWHSHRHSPWAPHARCTEAGDGMDAGRGGTVGGNVFWIFFFFLEFGEGAGWGESCTSLMVAALLLHEHRMSSRP